MNVRAVGDASPYNPVRTAGVSVGDGVLDVPPPVFPKNA